jgi:hypothetical protein
MIIPKFNKPITNVAIGLWAAQPRELDSISGTDKRFFFISLQSSDRQDGMTMD